MLVSRETDIEKFASKSRYLREIADFFNVSLHVFHEMLDFYGFNIGKRRILSPEEIKKIHKKITN